MPIGLIRILALAQAGFAGGQVREMRLINLAFPSQHRFVAPQTEVAVGATSGFSNGDYGAVGKLGMVANNGWHEVRRSADGLMRG
jgi:hypothetical protein